MTGQSAAVERRVSGRLRRWVHEWTSHVPAPIRRLARWLVSPELTTTSAGLAFYALISLPPTVLIAFWVAGSFVSDDELKQLGTTLDERTPQELPVGTVLQGLIDVATTAGWVSVLAALWPATAYGAALARAFTEVAPDSERRLRGWRGRLAALGVVAVLPLVVLSTIVVLYLAPRVLGTGWLLTALLGVGAFAVLALVIAGLFGVFRLEGTRWRDVAVAALATTGLIAVVTGGYLVYLRVFADFTERYGASSLATLVLLALWLLLSNGGLLVGYRLLHRRSLRD
jgi:uncharacterized BrkB/YihY/UPF0761 family membrane protein